MYGYENPLEAIPSAFEAHPALYMATVFSLLLVNLLALEWLWRLSWGVFEKPHPLKHPVSTYRLVVWLLLVSVVLRSAPDLVLLMSWQELTPVDRAEIALWDIRLDSFSFFPFSLGWFFAHIGGRMLIYQLEKKPIPIHLWPTPRQIRRPLKIGVGAALIAALLTFAR